MREMYEVPAMELVELKCEDIILSSNPGNPGNPGSAEESVEEEE